MFLFNQLYRLHDIVFVSKDFIEVYGDLSQEYKHLCEKHAELKKSFNTKNDFEDMLDTLSIASSYLQVEVDRSASTRRKEEMKKTKDEIAEDKEELKRLSKYIAQVEEIASQVAAFPHRLVAERTFFDVVKSIYSLFVWFCMIFSSSFVPSV